MAFFAFLVASFSTDHADANRLDHLLHRQAADRNYALSPAQYWVGGWSIAPRIPVAGDVEGSHRADLVSIDPAGAGGIGVMRTSSVGKPQRAVRALGGFGGGALAAVCGRFAGKSADAVAVLLASGQIHVIYDAASDPGGKLRFTRDDIAATLTAKQMPAAPVEALVADFDGGGAMELLLIGSDGKAVLLRTQKAIDAPGIRFETVPIGGAIPAHRQVSAGTLVDAPDSRARLFYIDNGGALYRSVLTLPQNGGPPAFAKPFLVIDQLDPSSKMAAGHFKGGSGIDLIIGQTLFPDCNPAFRFRVNSLPTIEEARDDRAWIAADFDGNGKDDLLRARSAETKLYKDVALIHFSSNPESEPVQGYYVSTNDGLPDAWKLGRIKPAGLDLREIGCRVGHRDLIAEILPMADVPQEKLHQVLANVAAHYAAMPIQNPDGSTGISIHFIFRDPIPVGDRDYRKWNDWSDFWATMWPKYVLPTHIGIVHYMGMQNGSAGFGGGFKSWCGDGWPEFIHEMGHQLGLGHEGGDGLQGMSAVYPSLMNYSYSYGINGSSKGIGYSSGTLRPLGLLNEEHLNETLPLPYEAVKFLSGPPYHFHLKPGNDPNTTLVDWNWNGVFGEADVRADLSYSHGVTMNPMFEAGHSLCAPVVVAQRRSADSEHDSLLLFSALAARGSEDASLSAKSPGRLVVRTWSGSDRDRDGARYSTPVDITPDELAGDPTAVSVGDTAYVAFPTSQGVKICAVTLGPSGALHVGPSTLLADTSGAIPALTACGSKNLALFLWRGAGRPVAIRILPASDDATALTGAAEQKLAFNSDVPVSATAGAANIIAGGGQRISLWATRLAADAASKSGSQFEVVRFAASVDGPRPAVTEAERRSVHGRYAAERPTLLWEPESGLGPEGRLYFLAAGPVGQKVRDEFGGEYCAMQTAYPQENGGWETRRYYEAKSFHSGSAPGACWFQGNMVYALRQDQDVGSKKDVVTLSFRGTGATPQPVADFNDLQHIVDSGLRRSLEFVELP